MDRLGATIHNSRFTSYFPYLISHLWFANLKCNTKLCVFAPAGRDIYSLAILSLFLSSVGAQPLLPHSAVCSDGFRS